MPHSPLPWEYDCTYERHNQAGAGLIRDAKGKIICDTLNSDVREIHTAHDGPSVTYWDEQGRLDLRLAVHAVNCHAELLKALEDALELIDVVDGSGGGMLYNEPYKSKLAAIKTTISKAKGQ
jgi:hypothetical protein